MAVERNFFIQKLIDATYEFIIEAVKLLIDAGADINIKDINGFAAMNYLQLKSNR